MFTPNWGCLPFTLKVTLNQRSTWSPKRKDTEAIAPLAPFPVSASLIGSESFFTEKSKSSHDFDEIRRHSGLLVTSAMLAKLQVFNRLQFPILTFYL